jgi:hypothetical protein
MYQIIQSDRGTVIVLEQDGVRLSFTENPENTDYQKYLAWLAAGGVPEVIEPAEPEA